MVNVQSTVSLAARASMLAVLQMVNALSVLPPIAGCVADGECAEQQPVCLPSAEQGHLVRSHCLQHSHGLFHLLAGVPQSLM